MSSKVVEVWVADLTFPGYMDRLHRLAAEFGEAHPEYEIRIVGNDFRTLPQKIAAAAAQGRAPAIAECYFYITQAARDLLNVDGAPLFTSVEAAIGGRDEILGEPVVIDDIIPAVRDYYTYDGDLTSMPSVGTTSLLFANGDLADAAGIDELPRTWFEVGQACDRLRGVAGLDHTITWANHGMFFQQALAAQGGLLADNDNGRSGRATRLDLASPQMLAWVSWWQRLHKDGHYLYTGGIPDWQGTFQAFADQRVGLRITSSNDVNYMVHAARQSDFDLRVTRFPDNADSAYEGNGIAGTSLWLANGLDEVTQEGALAFLQFLHNPVNAADQHVTNSFLPITNASFDLLEESEWFVDNPHHRAASDQLKTYPDTPGLTLDKITPHGHPASRGALFGDFAGVQDVMTRAMGEVLSTGVDPAARFIAATAEAQALLDAYEADRADGGPSAETSLRVEYFADAKPYSGADLENVVALKRPTR
ncbi:extracellular solute-binding protein [Actinophytocola gossypii]|uniref:Extracellular solute-binding protein n=1 Tax=Actinophytocola gossypii TaxID=2812003 RepID=A0ABT2JHV2_9PSEU|nr:extracellular solute-binding protein [Actinophytocola gossypii]MCT2586824.1 extracellular solute-binding protein [Actinophytocola gossypii]